jgi:hypothetical protein
MGMWVKEVGKSEGRIVMTRIWDEAQADIARHESVQTSNWSLVTREFV